MNILKTLNENRSIFIIKLYNINTKLYFKLNNK